MDLILSRHGNTFGTQDPVVWTGATNDLPLVEKGIEQAGEFAQFLIREKIQPQAIYCGPLQRTSQYAAIIVQKLSLSLEPIIDPRINEIDYGAWTGLTQDQVIARFGKEALKAWDEQSRWPAQDQGNWGSSEAQVIQEVQAFAQDLVADHTAKDTVLVISSNGRLRYFLNLIKGGFQKAIEAGEFKVKTGNICKLQYIKNLPDHWKLAYWNRSPRN